jgi:hypothetical protein
MSASRALMFTVPLAFASALSCPSAQAAPPAGGHVEAFQAVLDCRSVTDDARRLACYDAAAGRMETAAAKGEIVVVDQAKAREARTQAFGLSVPSLDFLTRGLKANDVERVEGVVTAVNRDASGRWIMQLADGAVWRQISNEVLARDPKPGTKVSVRKALAGSFMMNVDGQAGIRVHRDR